MEKEQKWWTSATHLVLIGMSLALIYMTVYSLIFSEWNRFDFIMTLFSNIMIAVTSFYFGKSTLESANRKSTETEKMIKEATAMIP